MLFSFHILGNTRTRSFIIQFMEIEVATEIIPKMQKKHNSWWFDVNIGDRKIFFLCVWVSVYVYKFIGIELYFVPPMEQTT